MIPAVTLLVIALFAAALHWPALMPLAVVAATQAVGALALVRRPSRRLRIAVGVLAAAQLLALYGAWALRAHDVAPWFLVVVAFVLPLPLAPWLYAWSAPRDDA